MTTLAKLEKAEEVRVNIYEYFKTHRDCTMSDVISDLGITKNQATHHLRYLVGHNHIVKMVRRNAAKRFAIYNLGRRPYSRKAKVNPVRVKPEVLDLSPQVKAVTRVFKLLDRKEHIHPKAKPRKTNYGSMQSGMAMFGNW
jgi:hypothetical protein